jgi:hypothetical protein
MQDHESDSPVPPQRTAWNKGKLIGVKPPLRPKHVWSVRTKLQLDGRTRDLAMFNVAIDSKLRGCDVVALKVEDIAPKGYAVERATSACVGGEKKTASLSNKAKGQSAADVRQDRLRALRWLEIST